MKYALIGKNDKVTNIIEWDGKTVFEPNGKLVKLDDDIKESVDMGWEYKNGKLSAPKEAKTDKKAD